MSAETQSLLAQKLPKNFTRAYFHATDKVVFLNKKTQVRACVGVCLCVAAQLVCLFPPSTAPQSLLTPLFPPPSPPLTAKGCAIRLPGREARECRRTHRGAPVSGALNEAHQPRPCTYVSGNPSDLEDLVQRRFKGPLQIRDPVEPRALEKARALLICGALSQHVAFFWLPLRLRPCATVSCLEAFELFGLGFRWSVPSSWSFGSCGTLPGKISVAEPMAASAPLVLLARLISLSQTSINVS